MAINNYKSRGLRNCNPLNIRIGNTWRGERKINTDGEFEQFISMEFGIRAAFILLRRYICHYGLKSIRQIVARWAPRSENQTDNYVNLVAKYTGLDPDEPLQFDEVDVMVKVFNGMCLVENGMCLDEKQILRGYSLVYDI